jgi:hypothetical protein
MSLAWHDKATQPAELHFESATQSQGGSERANNGAETYCVRLDYELFGNMTVGSRWVGVAVDEEVSP